MLRFVILFLFGLVTTAASACRTTIVVKNQAEFDGLQAKLTSAFKAGDKNIYVKLRPGTYIAKEKHLLLKGITAAGTKIHIIGDNAILVPSGRVYHEGDVYQGSFSVDNSWMNGAEDVEFWSYIQYADGLVEILDADKKRCRLKTKTNNNNIISSNSYILIPHWFKSSVYKIDKIEGQYIYFIADDLNTSKYGGYNINDDYNYGKKQIRYKLCHVNPGGSCLRITKGKVYLPGGVSSAREGITHNYITIKDCKFSSVEIKGIQFRGNAYAVSTPAINIKNSECKKLQIHKCSFLGMRGDVIYITASPNARIDNNRFKYCYRYGILSDNESANTVVEKNHFESMGKAMTDAKCARCQGTNYRISDNSFLNFGYGGISTGVWYKSKKAQPCSGVIENNDLSFSQDYLNHIDNYGIMDGGAIYIATRNTRTIVRNNHIHGFSGMHSNRGIFCDDGAFNVEIYGNVITGIANSYCIDSRRVRKVERSNDPESPIERANINIIIRDNTIDGGIRFVAHEGPDNGCVKGTNYILPGKKGKMPEMTVKNVVNPKQDKVKK